MELSQNLQISSDPETKGFDLSAGKTWIYPENYPVRDYQYNIVQASLYSNTLVSLPTGLGKTFIAAVVMYNFWRWYPRGKVIFLAPTKPLVAQQIFACHNTMGIPNTETIELTGSIIQKQREVAWTKKRVVFATPQVFHNDLEKNVVPGDLVKCIVIDEAHKALGKHSYCQCIRLLSEKNQNFRVLALSATPGNKISNVHEILKNLLIAHVELRDETSLDVIPYINKRKIDVILVPLNDELAKYKERYIFIMDRHVKVLLKCNVLHAETANISKGRIFHLLKEFQKQTNRSGNYGQIMKRLNILLIMYHAYELMVRDGLRAFYKFYQNHGDKFWMNEEIQLQKLLEDIKTYLGPFPDINTMCEKSVVDIPQNLVFGHTKFEKLKELLLHHFTNNQEKQGDTRAIVFVEYRNIVSEIYILLLQCQPLIRPQMFVGQAGQKQKQQLKALENFRNNHVNVLISTSIGEEGLDVGEVDLIICFDVSQHSPTRLVQRMGRTGRKRDGHIVILVTDGREHETLKFTMARRDSLNNKMLNPSNIFSSLYQRNPRMIPDIFTPECLKMHINVQPKSPVTKNKHRKDKSNRRNNTRQDTLKRNTLVDSNASSQKGGTKFSITKFFKTDQRKEHTKGSVNASDSDTIQNNSVLQNNNAIKPSDVRILSHDNDAIDFLTTCVLRNSKKEKDTERKCKIDKSHVSAFPPNKNLFNFSIPDNKVLRCLTTLDDTVPVNCNKNCNFNDNNDSENNNNNNNNKNNLYDNEPVLAYARKQIENECTVEESKFEHLLDDSSSSNKDMLNSEEENYEDNNFSRMRPITSQYQYPESGVAKLMKIEARRNTTQYLKPSRFEDILDETSDDSESNTHVECFKQVQIEHIGSCNDVQTEQQSTDNMILNGNTESSDVHVRETIKVNDDFEQKNENNCTSKRLCESEERTFTISQAIEEISRLNSNTSMQKIIDESEDDMFEDESFLVQIDNDVELIEKGNNATKSNESNDKIVLNKSRNSDDRNNTIDTEFNIEEYEWDDDFETLIDPVSNCTKFNAFEEKTNELRRTECNVETEDSDSERCNSVHDYVKEFVNDKSNYKNVSFSTDRVENNERSYLSSNSKNNLASKLHDTLSLKGRNEKWKTETETKHFRRRNYDRKLRKAKNKFIQDEAEVSFNGYTTDESSGTDEDLESFVSYTQNVHDESDMHAYYLKTIKSPIKRHDGFVFKQLSDNPNLDVYSQPVTEADESYMNDSFCVAEDENEDLEATRVKELSQLERAERRLERLKRKRINDEESNCNSRKRRIIKKREKISNCCKDRDNNICIIISSSSEDEIEKLRKQIKD